MVGVRWVWLAATSAGALSQFGKLMEKATLDARDRQPHVTPVARLGRLKNPCCLVFEVEIAAP